MKEFDRLIDIMEKLRAPGGCPWDAQQDHKTLSRYIVEEAYELVEAIQNEDISHLKEELGDVLLQVVFHATIARQNQEFTIQDVIDAICEKLVYRHPHVFGDVSAETPIEVIRNWEQLKKKERNKENRQSILDGIPKDFPSLLYARKIQSLASRAGFDWQDTDGVMEKIREEIDELSQAIQFDGNEEIEEELGDLLFSIVNLSRFQDVDPEIALRKTNRKFIKRFHEIEKKAKSQGVSLEDMTLDEMDDIWEQSKGK